jgi:hypothetical protein
VAAADQTRHLRLVETLAELHTRLRARANSLEEAERQRVVRLLVQEILVGSDSITIRHSIPMPSLTPDSNDESRSTHGPPQPNRGPCYLLHSHSQHTCDNVSEATEFSLILNPICQKHARAQPRKGSHEQAISFEVTRKEA